MHNIGLTAEYIEQLEDEGWNGYSHLDPDLVQEIYRRNGKEIGSKLALFLSHFAGFIIWESPFPGINAQPDRVHFNFIYHSKWPLEHPPEESPAAIRQQMLIPFAGMHFHHATLLATQELDFYYTDVSGQWFWLGEGPNALFDFIFQGKRLAVYRPGS